jgi:molybdopterin/thiamine biosynthesis adenylyltransferase
MLRKASMDLYRESFKRNLGLLDEAEQERLKDCRVAIAGLGGVGGIHLVTLARIGVGAFNIADNDTFEAVNFNRQYGASVNTIGSKKTDVMAEIARSINPEAKVELFSEGINPGNIDRFLEGVDFAVDAIDFFAIDARRLLFRKAREKGIYAATSGPIGFGATLQVFSPEGMGFDEYFGITDGMEYVEKMIAFSVGLTPSPLHLKYMDLKRVDLKAGTGPSIASACALCANLVATAAVDILLKRGGTKPVPHYFQFDPYRQIYKKRRLWMGGSNPLQKLKRWFLLKKIKPLLE